MAEQEQLENKAKFSARTIVLSAILAFLLGIGVSSAWLFLYGQTGVTGIASGVAALLAPVDKEADNPPDVVEVGDFVMNIISEYEPRYARLSLALALDQPATREEVNKRMAQIRDTVILLINNKTFEELQDQQGKLQVKAELKNAINTLLTSGQVNEVYLTDFVVQ